MYLSKLEIVGFKSFAQKTILKFNGGISAIVGPNGCGKSNIVDAIRWVLGEQKTSVLRSDVMENVIFNGTKNRKPLSMAEVSLTLENTKGILPSEYSEVTVTRRLFRNGESEYLINKNKCRLKDIVDLFMDTGLGADSYSVIELKMVEAILSGRPEERRALFEEAAGIKKYKLRRKEAAKKLETVTADLTRVQDILDEVRKNVASLGRQAQKTRRYNNLMSEYKSLESSLLIQNYNILNDKSFRLKEEIGKLNQQKIKLEFDASETERQIRQLKEKYTVLENQYNLLIADEAVLQEKISNLEKSIAVSTEKLNNLNQSRDKIENEISIAHRNIEQSQSEIQNIELEIQNIQKLITELENKLSVTKEEKISISNQLNEAKSLADSANEKVFTLQSSINNLKNQQNRSLDRKKMLERKVQGNFEEARRLELQIKEINAELEGVENKRAQLQNDLLYAEKLLASEKERQLALQNRIESLKIKLNDKKNAVSSKKNTLEFLKSIVDTNQTAQFIRNSTELRKNSEINQLAELVATDDEYLVPVIAVLNYLADFYFVDSVSEAANAVDLLKQSKKGQAAFIAKDLIPENPKSDENTLAQMSFFDIIRCDEKVRNFLQLILGTCLITDNDTAAIELVSTGKCNCAVSKTGLFVHKSGYIYGGSEQKEKQSKLGRKEKIEKVQSSIAELNNAIDEFEKQISDINEELKLIDIHLLTTNVRQAESNLRNFEQKIAQTELRRQALEQSYEIVSQSNTQIEEEIVEISNEVELLEQKIHENTAALQIAKEEFAVTNSNLAKIDIQIRKIDDDIKSIEIELAKLNSELNSKDNDKKRLLQILRSLEIKIQQKQEELLNGGRLSEELSDKIIFESSNLEKLKTEYQNLLNKNDFLKSEKNSLSEQINQYNEVLSNLHSDYNKLKDALYQTEIKLSEINVQAESIKNKLIEDYQTNFEVPLPKIPEDFNVEDAKTKIIEIKNKLNALGNVNFLALEEYEKETERLAFYENQINDLLNAEKTLKETIAEINLAAERNFSETYEKIHNNFKILFKTLFGEEGEAELRIDEGKLLETDIEIIAKPPNKRPTSIEQLSGGEKTLTAIALLFAIYLVKPSPFCILDEVDAPLDDANIDKFLYLIRQFSNNTQFIIVTHNKRTMTAANTLYGVTMQEVGVSKTVSVSLAEIENFK